MRLAPTGWRGAWRSCLLGCLFWAAAAQAATLTLDKEPVVLGRSESVTVTVHVDEPPGTADRPLRLAVNVGSFGEVTRAGPGAYRVVYVPPTTRFPQVALVAVWRETGPEAPIEFLRIPLYGIAKIPVRAPKSSEVRIQVANVEFGPQLTDKKGKAVIAVEVPPGVRDSTVLLKDKKNVTLSRRVPVEVPAYNRLTAAVVPHAVLADGRSWARLEVFYDLGGAAVPPKLVKVVPSLGTASFVSAEAGRYVYRYVPPAGASAEEVVFSFAIESDPSARAEARLRLGLPPPTQLVVRPPEQPLLCDGQSSAMVSVLALDATGLGLAAQPIELTGNGRALGDLTYLGNGLYQVPFVAPDRYPPGGLVQFVATVKGEGGTPVTAAGNYQLRAMAAAKAVSAHFSPDPVPTDGRTEARLSLEVRDGAGLPLSGARLTVIPTHGAVGKLTELGEGRYETSYVPPPSMPEDTPRVRVVDLSGGFEDSVPIPVRADPHRLLLGVRGGLTYSLGDQLSPRVGADLWVPFRAGNTGMGVGLTGHYASASQTVRDASGAFSSRSLATYLPATARFGVELFASRRLSLLVGVGGQATYAIYETTLTATRSTAWGFGALGFAALGVAFGPGLGFVELGYAWAPVNKAQAFHLEAGGLALEIGYRFGVL
jgi:hypothetical protein